MADVKYAVTVDAAGAVTQIQKLDDAFKQLGRSTDSTANVGSALRGQLDGLWKSFVAGQFVVEGLRKGYEILKNFVVGSISAAKESEMTEARLSAALKATGREVEMGTRYYMAHAQALQGVTIYRKNDIASAEAMLLTLTKLDRDGMDDATKLAIGLAAVYGGDLNTYIRQVAMGFEGQYMQLGRLLPTVREATTAHDKHAAMIKASGQMFEIAQAQAATFGGRIAQINNFFYQFQEKVGQSVTQSKALQFFLSLISETLKQLAQAPDPTRGPLGMLMATVNATAQVLNRQFGPALLLVAAEQAKANEEAKNLIGGLIGQTVAYTPAGLAAKKHADALKAAQAATEAYEKSLTALQTKSGETLKAELADAQAALNAALARKEESGVVEELAKKVATLKEKLEGTNFELDKFGHFVPKGSQVALVFRDIDVSTDTATASLNEYKTVMGRLVGGELGKIIDSMYDYKGAAEGDVVVTYKLKQIFDALSRTEIKVEMDKTKKALDEMALSGRYTADEFLKLYNRWVALKKELAEPTWTAKLAKSIQDAIAIATPIVQGFSAIFSQMQTNNTIAVDNWYKKQVDIINKTVKDETKKQQALIALEAEYQIKRTSAAREAAKGQKAVALMEAVVNTAAGVARAFSDFMFPLSVIIAGIVGALGAVQIGLIAAQPIPLAKGALFTRPTRMTTSDGRAYEMGEAGPELLSPEPRLRTIIREETKFSSSRTVLNINSPLINTSGLTRADLENAGAELFAVIERQGRRRGRLKLASATG